MKLCYAVLIKGLIALASELLVAARVMGPAAALRGEQHECLLAALMNAPRDLLVELDDGWTCAFCVGRPRQEGDALGSTCNQ